MKDWMVAFLIDSLLDFLIDFLTFWLNLWVAVWLWDRLTDWLIGGLTDGTDETDFLIDLIDWPDWLTDLADWLTGWLIQWLIDWLIWLPDWPDWLTDWLTNWLTDWLPDWMPFWQIGWLTAFLIPSVFHKHRWTLFCKPVFAKKGSNRHCSQGPWLPPPKVSMLMLVVRSGCLLLAKKDSIRARLRSCSLGFNIDKRGKGWSNTGRQRFEKGTFFANTGVNIWCYRCVCACLCLCLCMCLCFVL